MFGVSQLPHCSKLGTPACCVVYIMASDSPRRKYVNAMQLCEFLQRSEK